MKESGIQQQIGKLLNKNRLKIGECFTCEVKIVKSSVVAIKPFRIPFAIVKEHQIAGLINSLDGVYHKLSDMFAPNGAPTQKKPFDFVFIKAQKAYIAICLYVPRKMSDVYFIDVIKWVQIKSEFELKKRKSMNEFELAHIADKKVSLYKRNNGGLFNF